MTVIYDNIIAGAKSRALFPTSQITLTDEDLYSYLDDIIRLEITSQIDRVAQEFFVRRDFIPLEAGVSEYSIPYRAMGRSLREIKWYDSSNNRYRNMPQIKLEDANTFANWGQMFYGFYFMGDKIMLVPDVSNPLPSETYNIAVWYKLIPSQPIPLDDAARVSAVTSPTVTVDNVPDTLTVGASVDFIAGRAGCAVMYMDRTITNIAGTTLTFDADDIPSNLAAGDYISVAQTSPVLNMIPEEASGLIQNKLSQLMLKSVGDEVGANALEADIARQQDSLLKMIAPRINGEPQIIISRNNLTRWGRNWNNWNYGRVT